MKTITIPKSESTDKITIEIEKNCVIVGANGAGKSRLGAMLEVQNGPSKRISAQRYLQFNEIIPRLDYDTAQSQLSGSYKHKASIQPQNDYQQVFVSLFAEEARRDAQYVSDSKQTEEKIQVPLSVKEKVVEIWNFIFPYRVIKLEKDRVRAVADLNDFPATQLSDGEKVGLYLICQTLLAEENCILIIDEPELHLHKALMVRLWNKLEEFRSDCTFIYITHDLDFAVSKPSSKTLWIQSFNQEKWKWIEFDSNEVVPENLFLEILGSRKPILLVEGEKGSLDVQMYQAYYENFTVLPRGSCEKVIESVKGLKNNPDLHDKNVFGLIDKDFRPDEQLASFKESDVFSVPVNQIENIFLVPEIIEIVCKHLGKDDKKENIISSIREIYDSDKNQISFMASKYRMQRVLNLDFGAIKNQAEYDAFKASILPKLDGEIVLLNLPEKNDELIKILKVYPHKGLVRRIQSILELSRDGYKNLVLSFLASQKRQEVFDILKLYFPVIE